MAWKVIYFLLPFIGIPGVLYSLLADIGLFMMSNWKINIIFCLSSAFCALRIYWYHRDKLRKDKKERLEIKIMEQQNDINNSEIFPHQ